MSDEHVSPSFGNGLKMATFTYVNGKPFLVKYLSLEKSTYKYNLQ